MKPRGLGDSIANFTQKTGIKAAVQRIASSHNNGTILVSDKITDPEERRSVIEHEKIHIDQMKRGDLDYDNDFVYWKGKKYSRDDMKEGAQNLPWEAEAYAKTDPFEKY
jgi:hypothetical protein